MISSAKEEELKCHEREKNKKTK